jgi:hypothetical protein
MTSGQPLTASLSADPTSRAVLSKEYPETGVDRFLTLVVCQWAEFERPSQSRSPLINARKWMAAALGSLTRSCPFAVLRDKVAANMPTLGPSS